MRLEQVGKRYALAGSWVLRDVEAAIEPGRAVRVTGSNGSGKSTLLRIVAGVCAPSAGRVIGRPATGYVPERFPAALPFTVRGYLRQLARVHGLRAASSRRRVDDCMTRLGIEGYADADLASLSKGTSQKVAVAQAVVAEPALLVLDEAWTGLDDAARRTLDEIVAGRLADGGAVVFVDHDPARLAGLPAEHWHVSAGHVATHARQDTVDVGADGIVVIDIVECAHSADRLATLPGVFAVDSRGSGSHRLRVARTASDAVLRALLDDRALHVSGLHEESTAPEPAMSEGETP
jgi:ABC-type Mn2+/Zn2+ transport system ATPase subunit